MKRIAALALIAASCTENGPIADHGGVWVAGSMAYARECRLLDEYADQITAEAGYDGWGYWCGPRAIDDLPPRAVRVDIDID